MMNIINVSEIGSAYIKSRASASKDDAGLGMASGSVRTFMRTVLQDLNALQQVSNEREGKLRELRSLFEETIVVGRSTSTVRVDVHFCGLTGSDALLWRNEHRIIPGPTAVLGFEATGSILEMGRLAHERTGYQMGEKVVVHNYPVCGGLAESCLVHYRDVFRWTERVPLKDAAVITDDYFSALLAMGRRARIQKDECFLVNAKYSRSALAVIDLAIRVFGAKPIALCNDVRRAKLCADLGAKVVYDKKKRCSPYKLRELIGKEEVRVLIETEGGPCFRSAVECLNHDGLIVLLDDARNRRHPDLYLTFPNYTVFAVAPEHYKVADTLVYRETMQHLFEYHSTNTIRPRISAIFGLHRVNDAFDYYTTTPSGNVLIDMKDLDRLTICDEIV